MPRLLNVKTAADRTGLDTSAVSAFIDAGELTRHVGDHGIDMVDAAELELLVDRLHLLTYYHELPERFRRQEDHAIRNPPD